MSLSAATTAARAAMNAARPVLLPPWGAGAGTTPSSCTPIVNSSSTATSRGFAALSAHATHTATPLSLSTSCTPILNGPTTGHGGPSGARSIHRLVTHTPTLDLLRETAATSSSSEKVAAAAMSTTAAMVSPRHTVPQWGMFFHEAHVDVTTPFKREMATVQTEACAAIDAATAIDAAEASATTAPSAAKPPQWSMFFHPAAPQFWTASATPKNINSSSNAPQHRTMATTSTPASAAALPVAGMSASAEWQEFPASFDASQTHETHESTPGPAVSEANAYDPVSAANLHEKNEWAQFWHDPTWHPENTNTSNTATTSSMQTTETAAADAASSAKGMARTTAVDQIYMASVLGLAPSEDTAIRRPPLQAMATPTEAAGVSIASSASVLCLGILAGGSGSVLGVASAVPIF